MLRITLFILSVITVSSQAGAQTKSLCTLVTAEDARAFFDKVPDLKMDNPDVCFDGVKAQSVMLSASHYTAYPNAKQVFDMNRTALQQLKDSPPKDEPGLGATAFSTSTKSGIMITLLKGNATLQIAAGNTGGAPVSPALLDKLRIVAKKAAGRM